MKEQTSALLGKAARAIHAAEVLVSEGEADFAAGRAYYAMFYAAEALLFERGLRFRKHGGVHAAFGQHFAKTGALDPKYHRWLLEAFAKRVQGDYGIDAVLTADEAIGLIAQAKQFIEAAHRHLSSNVNRSP